MFSLFDIIAEILLKVALNTITPNLDMAILDGELQLLNISFKGNQPRTFQAIFGLNLLQCFKEDLNIENTQPQHKKELKKILLIAKHLHCKLE
jgi:hypothetical protein